MASTNLKEKWDRTHLCGSIYGEHCEHLMYATQEKNEYNNKALDIYCVYCTANGTARKIGGAATWTGLSPKYCYKRHNQEITEDKTMAFDFTNIKAKGKLNGLSFYSSVSDNDSVHEIPLDLIDSFEGHPFSVVDNDDMVQLAESVKHNGIMNPAIVREKGSGRYELISGHRRKRACELAGLKTLKAYVKQLTDEEATIIMVDSNLQREKILPSERAFAYKMKYEVLKKSVGRPTTDKLSPVATKSGRTDEQIGDMFGESKDTVRRYIRLTYLIKEIRDMVDDDKLSIRAAVEISYIEPAKQAILVPFMQKYDVTINKAAELREWSDNGGLTDNETVTSLFTGKSAKKESSHKTPNAIKYKQIKSYIPDSVLKEDYQSYVIKALLFYRDNGEII